MRHVDYNRQLYTRFHEGRVHEASVMEQWATVARRCLGNRNVSTLLDLGSGTGRFSDLLADALNCNVVGVEPSQKMREVAQTVCKHPQVRFVAGSADAIPLDDGSCDGAWLSQVVHHFQDLPAVARELRRVVRESGSVVIRSNFQGRLKGFSRFYDFFPSALAIDEARHPSVEQVRDWFAACGFQPTMFETIEQQEADSLAGYADRIRLRTYSTFELMSDHDYEEGLRALFRGRPGRATT